MIRTFCKAFLVAKDLDTTSNILRLSEVLKEKCKEQGTYPCTESFFSAKFHLDLTFLKLAHAKGDFAERNSLASRLLEEKYETLQDEEKILLGEAFYEFAVADDDIGNLEEASVWLEKALKLLSDTSHPDLYEQQKLKIDRFLVAFFFLR